MNDHSLFLLTPDDVARVYSGRIYLVEDLLKDETPAVEQPLTLLTEVEPQTEKVATEGAESQESQNGGQEPSKPARKASYDKPGIEWRPKESSKVLFILHQAELKNKVLTELLKQIVLSINIPFESAGFGIIKGPVSEMEFQEMPNPYGIVFDPELLPGEKNPMPSLDGSIFFTGRLKDLQHDKNAKRALWEYLKSIKDTL